jgi:hypothetical protein
LIEASIDASEQSGDSTQKLPGQSPSNAEMAVDTAETLSGDSTQKLPGQSLKNTEIAATITETSIASPSAGPPSLTSVGGNVVASEESGDSNQKLSGQSPKNPTMEAATTETSIATPSTDLAPPTSDPPPLAGSATCGAPLDSSQENPNAQGD